MGHCAWPSCLADGIKRLQVLFREFMCRRCSSVDLDDTEPTDFASWAQNSRTVNHVVGGGGFLERTSPSLPA